METITKKHITVGPFPGPLGVTVKPGDLSFQEYTEYSHSDSGSDNCCSWKVEDKKHIRSEVKTVTNICGPFSKIDSSIYFTCQDQKCEVKCLCSLCNRTTCPAKLCKASSNCPDCNKQCDEHPLGMQRNFSYRNDFKSRKDKFPGIPKNCHECKNNFDEHELFHSVIHLKCKFCKYAAWKTEGASTLQEYKENETRLSFLDDITCQYCYKIFSRPDNRQKHEKEVHKCKEKTVKDAGMSCKYHCDYCDQKFSMLKNLIRHKAIHDEEYSLLKCDQCGQTFGRKDNKERHLYMVHKYVERNKNSLFAASQDVKKFVCDICNETFQTKQHLVRHKDSVHSKDETFPCRYCDKAFLRKDNAKRHSDLYCKLRPFIIVFEVLEELLTSL